MNVTMNVISNNLVREKTGLYFRASYNSRVGWTGAGANMQISRNSVVVWRRGWMDCQVAVV